MAGDELPPVGGLPVPEVPGDEPLPEAEPLPQLPQRDRSIRYFGRPRARTGGEQSDPADVDGDDPADAAEQESGDDSAVEADEETGPARNLSAATRLAALGQAAMPRNGWNLTARDLIAARDALVEGQVGTGRAQVPRNRPAIGIAAPVRPNKYIGWRRAGSNRPANGTGGEGSSEETT